MQALSSRAGVELFSSEGIQSRRQRRNGRHTGVPLSPPFRRLLQFCLAASLRSTAAVCLTYHETNSLSHAPQRNGARIATTLGLHRSLPRLFDPWRIPLLFKNASILLSFMSDASVYDLTDMKAEDDASLTSSPPSTTASYSATASDVEHSRTSGRDLLLDNMADEHTSSTPEVLSSTPSFMPSIPQIGRVGRSLLSILDVALQNLPASASGIISSPSSKHRDSVALTGHVTEDAVNQTRPSVGPLATVPTAEDREISRCGDAPDVSPFRSSPTSSSCSTSTPSLTGATDFDSPQSGTLLGSDDDRGNTSSKDHDANILVHDARDLDRPSLSPQGDVVETAFSEDSPSLNAQNPIASPQSEHSPTPVGDQAFTENATSIDAESEAPKPPVYRPAPQSSLHTEHELPHLLSPSGEEYALFGLLAYGGWSTVYWAQAKDGSSYAIKVSRKTDLYQDGKARTQLLKEKHILQRITDEQKPGLVGIIESWSDWLYVYFVMPLCPLTLHELLFQKFPVSVPQTKWFCAELVVGLRSLHELGYMHCDIKTTNIVLDPNGHLRLVDMGLAYGPGDPEKLREFRCYEGPVGTLGYVAPEVCLRAGNHIGYGCAADIWGLGLVFLDLVARNGYPSLIPSVQSFKDQLSSMHNWDRELQNRLDNWVDNPLAHGLLKRMLHLDESKRPSLEQMMQDPFFAGINWDEVGKKSGEVRIPHVSTVLPPAVFDSRTVHCSGEQMSNVVFQMKMDYCGDEYEYRTSDDLLDDPYHGSCALYSAIPATCPCHEGLCWC
ncbi:kinase-like protein [Obba rivulosa]|uniref:non-specific serine/threonine protein kinase n=1 Tax=Obba rivulosa TaxID=1052685 RepID=A0A8E2AMJ2_9APHY|nr:kinase-like protein [Obba rivulosa]